jgi:hypothetical protein
MTNDNHNESPKSGVVTLLLCLFLGTFGVHRFYVGKIGTGILMLLTAGGFGIWTIVDIVRIACCDFTDKDGKYVMFRKESKSRTTLIFTILGLVFLSIVVYVFFLVMLVMHLTGGLMDTVYGQMNALQQGDYAKAYSYTSSEFQKSTSLPKFKKFMEKYPLIAHHESVRCPERKMENEQGYVMCKLQASDGGVRVLEYLLVKENDTWKILGLKLNR